VSEEPAGTEAPSVDRTPGLLGHTRPAHWPSFASAFPRDAEIEALVEAFARGDYRRVRDEASALAERATADDVRAAARELRARVDPDPLGRWLIAIAAALLAILAYWYLVHRHGAT
jgi:hypothetical protein